MKVSTKEATMTTLKTKKAPEQEPKKEIKPRSMLQDAHNKFHHAINFRLHKLHSYDLAQRYWLSKETRELIKLQHSIVEQLKYKLTEDMLHNKLSLVNGQLHILQKPNNPERGDEAKRKKLTEQQDKYKLQLREHMAKPPKSLWAQLS